MQGEETGVRCPNLETVNYEWELTRNVESAWLRTHAAFSVETSASLLGKRLTVTDIVDFDFRRPWYHGSEQRLTVLRVGSSITQNPDVARAFSHRPSFVSQLDDGTVRHSGIVPGYLYVVSEDVRPEDVFPHPHPVNVSRWEWLTKRELRVQLIEQTQVRDKDRLSEDEIASFRQKLEAAGVTALAEWRANE